MGKNLSYVIVTPNSIAKSRTGGVIARLLSQTDLELSAAQLITPGEDFVREYAESIRRQDAVNLNTTGELLAGYVERNMVPSGGRRHRFLLLIFKGENTCKKLSDICGSLFPKEWDTDQIYGETIRDTYADYILDPNDNKKVIYFEPAVLTPRIQKMADENLVSFVKYFKNSENIIHNISYPDPSKIEQTLVILKPDNWQESSSRPGTIIDMFSRTGLRIIGTKIFRFSLNQALDFYGPVENDLKEKLAEVFAKRAKEYLEREFAFTLSQDIEETLTKSFGMEYAKEQFYKIINFMSGRRPDTCLPSETDKYGDVKCMILLYEGENAVNKIRDVLGPTDPLKAPSGTVRREFGSNVMVNTAHASDSPESCEREKKIVKINENSMIPIINDYLARI
jgi:nucleoside diphosphate kinase